MAVYKVIQDVESEDKLFGPLTLKAFIYAAIAGTCAFINFRLLMIGTSLKWIFIIMFLMPMILFGVLASPLGREQPTEVWLLSKIRFFLKARRRIWDQEGVDELVTVTAPKKIEDRLTKDLTQTEVHSRLKTLASTLDTRGWAIKNVDTNLNAVLPQNPAIIRASDRLVPTAGYTQSAPVIDIHPSDDILDEQNNPTAQKFANLMQKADDTRKQGLMNTIRGLVGVSPDETTGANDMSNKGMSQRARHEAERQARLEKRIADAKSKFATEHHKTKKAPKATHSAKSAEKPKAEPAKKTQPAQMTAARQAVNMELAQSGSAFSVATLSQLANRQPRIEQTGPDEVTISLH